MAVDLPPALPPQQELSAELRAAAPKAETLLDFKDYRLHILGSALLEKPVLDRAVRRENTVAGALRELTAAYYAAGYLGIQLLFSQVEDDVYIWPRVLRVSEVEGPPPLVAHFADLDGKPLTGRALEPERALASLRADRMQQQVALRLVPDSAEFARLEIDPLQPVDYDRIRAEVGNLGNRYAGRGLAGLTGTWRFSAGTEAQAAFYHGFPWDTRGQQSGAYDEGRLAANHVTTLGVFGADAQLARYEQGSGDGRIEQAGVFWTDVLAANLYRRWTVSARFDGHRKTLDDAAGAELQRERYASAELGTSVGLSGSLGPTIYELTPRVNLRQGLGGDVLPAESAATPEYFLSRAGVQWALRGDEITGSALVPWHLMLAASGQWSEDGVPEQQQFVLGGIDNIAGWLPGVAVGDRGWHTRAQLEYRSLHALGLDWAPRVFIESARADLRNDAVVQTAGRRELSDAGVGLGVSWRRRFELQAVAASRIDEQGLSPDEQDAFAADYFVWLTGRF